MLRHLIAPLALAALATPAAAQDFLSRAEVEALMQDAAFCYYPDARFSCAWAELYTEFNDDHTILITASATWDFPMEVAEYRIDWRGDALCIPFEDQGLRAMLQADGYRFPFSLEGLERLPDDGLEARREELRTDAPREFCFQYTHDPDIPGQLLQHVFRDGTWDADQDPIALIPRLSSGVAVRPG